MARLLSIELTNFKNVGHGRIEFPSVSGKGDGADIIGIYGQNGSGKTAVIEALEILFWIIMGSSLDDSSADCIRFGCDEAQVCIEVAVPNRGDSKPGSFYKVNYCVTLGREQNLLLIRKERLSYLNPQAEKPRKTLLLEHINIEGEDSTLFSTTPKTFWDSFFSSSLEFATEYRVLERVTRKERSSLLFSLDFFHALLNANKILDENERHSETKHTVVNRLVSPLLTVIVGLKEFALNLSVLTTVNNARVSLNNLEIAPWCDPHEAGLKKSIVINIDEPSVLSQSELVALDTTLNAINTVLVALVPGLTLAVQPLGNELCEDGDMGSRIEIVSHRGDCMVPFRCESEGVKKIVSILGHLINVYNNEDCCVAIDELDSGIFEFLLGELLEVLAEHGKGQLIFTAHNLRPLETLPTRSLIFTTTNPDKRYIEFSGVRSSNNLRDLYLRAINLGGQSETVYEPTSKYEIDASFYDAGCFEVPGAEE